jgi:hypothetical protein
MGQTSDPEMLVMHQKMTPGNNPEDFKQHYDHGGSLQLQKYSYYLQTNFYEDPSVYTKDTMYQLHTRLCSNHKSK